jgi:outer membrane protein assembly factor BamB
MDWAGTLYVSETRAGGTPEIIGIDSNNGLAKFRVSVPRRRRITAACESLLLGPPTIPDGMAAAYQFVVASDALQCPASGDKRWSKREVYMLRVHADGSSDETMLTDFQSPYPDPPPAITLFKVIPDAQGGMMAMMRVEMAGTAPINRVFYLSESGTDSYSLPVIGETVTGHRWAFTSDGHTIIAFDPKTGRVGWSRTATAGEIHIRFAEEKGGVVVETIRGQEVLAADDGASRLLGPVFGDALPTKRR